MDVSKTERLKPHTLQCMHQIVVPKRAHEPFSYNCLTIKGDEKLIPYRPSKWHAGTYGFSKAINELCKFRNRNFISQEELKFLAGDPCEKADQGGIKILTHLEFANSSAVEARKDQEKNKSTMSYRHRKFLVQDEINAARKHRHTIAIYTQRKKYRIRNQKDTRLSYILGRNKQP